ncbi:ATP-dependent RNA helicase DHX37/DHR1 [Cryptococcus neoformans C23]|uniref:RNA helicase n=1 Tax=Cryptococcus neoformans (strain H99 / ATCC 208821 / CBS 10515 / FGSC 9487) TaxID=235443 RepID=J9VX25_CRYN9|nr:ATP-dependent RNA helicase DHX37/DHR1 [Cryptococcus neoformans var. grubii H99]AUB28010.1 ATP-dependent RNA helicase DHX37/DHR1 [Cryptococcus neoformans var. grubii]OWZ27697.1 ATP-dependent RNA helicase DHX37/DHR1 [Cryptococcus neoformans var. grubii AD2-60a]OWZ40001.1 ATP-dependent RNA helicase DHX37/DHR1 [Cryptococcus neoformans var. grubii C23]OXC81937.1 ATP-dependent RNA helicase DHX37/DHR1 [Cryptococcus neoformans var. grubii AD1-7a]AFR97931.1 ATP-dependent RNA helicase DHX37/DHR1 [Cry|eukprot:XP_012052714.1 ATP-dependent RNA helicase DHX37/DHR1 [Cryptococcus neoformans var. grubii H99]
MAGPPVRQRYNAKARGSVAGGSSHKKRKNITKEHTEEDAQDNEADQHGAVFEDPTAGMSSKKRKRFESYMAKKLKSEQRLETFKLLQSLAPSSSTSASLLSASTLGQNPLNPTSAKERQEKREDRFVRRGIDRLSKRFGEGDDDSGESENDAPSRKGKGKAKEVMVEIIRDGQAEETEEVKTTVIPSKGERKAEIKAAEQGKRKGKLPKKAGWNPNLLSTQAPNSSSSEFDSSDSGNDTSDEEPKKAAEPSPTVEPEPVSETIKSPISAPSAPTVLGGALKKSTDGQVVKPRVEIRRKKGFVYGMFGRRGIDHREDSDDEDEDSDDEDDDEEDDEMDSNEESSDEEDEEDSEEEGNEEEEEEEEVAPPKKKRSLGFKDWALKQMGQTSQPSAPDLLAVDTTTTLYKSQPLPAARVGEYIGPLGQELVMPTTSLLDQSKDSDKSKVRPNITRRPSVSEARMGLPILAEEQSIIESILMHPVVIICGETGSGKTTQVPQMLYEAGFGYKGSDNPGMVAVTQPRRVAAVSLAERVRSELNFPQNSSLVAHQIRYSSTTSPDTAIKFMTDGVLLRELASDFLLSRYSVVVVDEAHERGVNTDVLVGVLSRVAKLREKLWREGKQGAKPLRIVVMSATLRVSDFAENPTLFSKPPPVIHIAARQHPVTVHFSRRTVSDYVTEAYKKVSKIHARLPPGGILVFMTGQSEIQALCRKLEKKYGAKKSSQKTQAINDNSLPPEEREAEEVEFGKDEDLAADVDDGAAESDPEALDTDDEVEGIPGLEFDEPADAPLHVLPLYSLLPNDQQMLVFKPPPEGHRLVIISTNVAETSLTIPGIRYVVDSGRAKERHYDPTNGVQSFQVSWISKASASQRAGRAGRTGPGHCYRLYSSALFEDHFEQFSKPEILRMPIEGVVLQMKSMNIDAVINFPFPTPPDRAALRRAENLLTNLGALSLPTLTKMINGVQHKGSAGGQITDLGKAMAGFPVSPRFAKMLAIGTQHDCMSYIIAIVAGMSVGDPFIHEQSLEVDEEEDEAAEISHIKSEEIKEKEQRKETRRRFFKAQQQFLALGQGTSDMFKLLAAIGAYEYDPSPAFCAKTFIRLKAMQEIHQLRAQISSIAKVPLSKLLPPNDTQLKVLRQILAAGFIDQVAVREDLVLKKGVSYESTRGVAYRAVGLGSEPVFIHPSSALFHRAPPDFVVFSEIVRTSKPWMKGVTKINPAWLPSLGKGLCTFSKPMEMPTKGFARKSVLKDDEREVFVTPHFKDLGVDLPVMKKKQRREGTRWILVD